MPENTKPCTEKTMPVLDKSKTRVGRLKAKQTTDQASAEIVMEGLGMNAVTAAAYSKTFGALDIAECMAALIIETQRSQKGDLGGPEAMLAAQAITLNAIFTQLAYQASKMTIVDQIDRFTRLAFKAQAQCRATLETLAMIKNPPTVFARQANIAHGPQQVNNGGTSLLRASNPETAPIKILEGPHERMGTRTSDTTIRGDQEVAPVGTRHRSAKRRR